MKAQVAQLTSRLKEAEETIHAIQQGAVDAFVLEELGRQHRVFTLEGEDRPQRPFDETMQQGVATLDRKGTVAYSNQRLADLLRVPHERVVGTRLRELVEPEDAGRFDELFEQGRRGSGRGETRLKRGDGSTVAAYLTLNILPNESGPLIGLFVTDLTPQRDREQLTASRDALRDSDRRKNEFLAMLSHELRNPLAPIRNAVNILRLTGAESEAIQATCAMLERQVALMVRLVDDLLDVSRLTRNKIEVRKERVALTSVLDQALECVRPLAASLKHRLTVALPDRPVFLDADPARLTQVFANLLDNACKYMERGGQVTITGELKPGGSGGPGEVVVRVRDEGIGIPAEQLSRIFDLFGQVDSSLERSKSGLGIGLTLVTSLVEMHGGYVEVSSDGYNRGSEFAVHLPVAEGAPAPAPAARRFAAPEARSMRILVVDDNRDSAESLAQLLKLMGNETYTALDGIQALDVAEQLRPDVVLLDIGMPRLNGYDACRELRRRPWGKQTLVIAQTGWGQEEDRRRTEEAGFDGHLVKPVDPDALFRLIAAHSRPESG